MLIGIGLAAAWPAALMTIAWLTTAPVPSVPPVSADAIVVFGAAAYPNDLSDALADRMKTAVALYHAGHAARLVLSGGDGRGPLDPNEADAMAQWVLEQGVPESALIRDPRGRNTRMTARHIGQLAREYRWHRVVIVTHAWHAPRARLAIAQETGGVSIVVVAPDAPEYAPAVRVVLREIPGYYAYLLGVR